MDINHILCWSRISGCPHSSPSAVSMYSPSLRSHPRDMHRIYHQGRTTCEFVFGPSIFQDAVTRVVHGLLHVLNESPKGREGLQC